MNQHPKNLSLTVLALIGLISATSCGSPQNNKTSTSSHRSSSSWPKSRSNPRISTQPASDITPSARGCFDESGMYVVGSFIYWNSGYSDQVIAERKQSSGDENQKFKSISMDTKYSPGFQVGLGANLAWDGWDLFLNWTCLQSNPSKRAHTGTPKLATLLGLTAMDPNSTFLSSSFHAKGHFDFNALDLELGRHFYISQKLSLRPHAGLKSAWIRQKLNITYDDVISNPGAESLQTSQQSLFKDHMWGIGPRLGLKSRWVLGSSNIAFLGNIAASILLEDFQPSYSVNYLDQNGVPPSVQKIQGHEQQLKPVTEAFLGFDWGHCFHNATYLSLTAGYEMQYWWGQNKMNQLQQGNGSLNLHGLTASIRLNF